jgi:hypothetical protein
MCGEDYDVHHGRWIYYIDSGGPSYCQPDIVCIPCDSSSPILLIEVKLSYKKEARRKLRSLYAPLIQYLHPDHDIVRIQVCQNIRLTDEKDIHRMDQLMEARPSYKCIHWR